ncbi:DUF4244 domain-containing protein [Actinomyces minihominis]|nr:DUF4244 domain-containing protein [Actinomyces minihominis]
MGIGICLIGRAVATAGFAGLLVAVLKSGGVKGLLTGIIQSALSF